METKRSVETRATRQYSEARVETSDACGLKHLVLVMLCAMLLTACHGPALSDYPGQPGKQTNGFSKLDTETLVTGGGKSAGLWLYYASYDNSDDEYAAQYPRVIRTHFLPGATSFTWSAAEGSPVFRSDGLVGRLVYQTVYCRRDDAVPCATSCDHEIFGSCSGQMVLSEPVDEVDGDAYAPRFASLRPATEATGLEGHTEATMGSLLPRVSNPRILTLLRTSQLGADGVLRAVVSSVEVEGRRLDLGNQGFPVEVYGLGRGIHIDLDHPAAREIARFLSTAGSAGTSALRVGINQDAVSVEVGFALGAVRDQLERLAAGE